MVFKLAQPDVSHNVVTATIRIRRGKKFPEGADVPTPERPFHYSPNHEIKNGCPVYTTMNEAKQAAQEYYQTTEWVVTVKHFLEYKKYMESNGNEPIKCEMKYYSGAIDQWPVRAIHGGLSKIIEEAHTSTKQRYACLSVAECAWIIGAWLDDGTAGKPIFTVADYEPEIDQKLEAIGRKMGLSVVKADEDSRTYRNLQDVRCHTILLSSLTGTPRATARDDGESIIKYRPSNRSADNPLVYILTRLGFYKVKELTDENIDFFIQESADVRRAPFGWSGGY
ncbi:uncharacterized protein BX664DRAFT_186566 [Halteromyces radiatus]|uniref:uncharacterized protein n=1 Tax=Halteromyces radiatus TaxID=101107 RepID=UPI00221F4209|nr:uncharacterized protein BX664DRAFT_186566 [Halteromyces radiatus]KAI8082950.1 hypothetical protein BX664DRAFT_186566 [Halteromyces radiatus]